MEKERKKNRYFGLHGVMCGLCLLLTIFCSKKTSRRKREVETKWPSFSNFKLCCKSNKTKLSDIIGSVASFSLSLFASHCLFALRLLFTTSVTKEHKIETKKELKKSKPNEAKEDSVGH